MKRGRILLVILSLLIIINMSVIFAGTCVDTQRIIKLSSASNSHGALYNDASTKTETITYPRIAYFGGMYSDQYNNPATGAKSCPSGFSASRLLDSDYSNVFFCYKTNSGANNGYNYGGLSATGICTGPQPPYQNPKFVSFTSPTCQPSTTREYYFCYNNFDDAIARNFGGMYSNLYNNPITGGKNCPSGYNGAVIKGCTGDPNNNRNSVFGCSKIHSETIEVPAYNYDVCYTDFFPEYIPNVDFPSHPVCDSTNAILWLSANSNAHASTTQSASYNTPICFGDLICTAKASCNEFIEKTILSLSATTNSHISFGDDLNYLTKLCCTQSPEKKNCNNNGICDGTETEQSCPVDCVSCGIGEEWCLNGCKTNSGDGNTCGIGNERFCDGGAIDGTCSVTESCRCADCTNKQDHCSSGLICGTDFSCKSASDSYWSTTGDSLGYITEININDNGGSVLMNLINTNLNLEEQVIFNIYNEQIDESHFMESISSIAKDTTKINATWDINLAEISDKRNRDFYFTVKGQNSPALKINILDECFGGSTHCDRYTDADSCILDRCGVANASIKDTKNLICGGSYSDAFGIYTYNCACIWNSTAQTCRPQETRNDIDPIDGSPYNTEWQGNCSFIEDIETSCSTDEFMSYSWSGIWDWGSASDTQETENHFLGSSVGAPESNKYYYDPISSDGVTRESQSCILSSGDKIVPCPSQLKLPFFNFWNVIASLVLIAGIYLIWKNKKKIRKMIR